ncbi:ubiquitin carboxyl-terminal hydrolase 27 isoform X2 [Salvia miltiorrhiza]|uniref:ubiquitin carboxyl-terminal hydrolase 27 isoform X2 n=1 Tax=Salvia miltiorrhiza TaxID=226208 RepID=UPI0025ABE3C5|nr:ubiquitin carboxyl-terminal hydrolase 27 isoform X2 [Salvia miltiorrhiza]
MRRPNRVRMGTKKLSSLIRNGRRINWVSSSGWKISIGVLGAVGIIFASRFRKYLDFNISYQDAASTGVWVVPGLRNLGNNCFLNVVLQTLSSCASFRKYLWEMMEEYGSLSAEEVDDKCGDENLPLFSSLASLVEELCSVRHQRTVLNPRKLMAAMDHYIPNFNLSRQQDAEEAFSHLLSALREEISEHCVPTTSSLADLPALPNGRILTAKSSEGENDLQRWSRSFLKPFDGILGSVLLCQSCSFQISLDFQHFHSLHLSPPVSSDGTIMAGCTLEDCLKRYFGAEHIENYCCSNCWHTAAIEYVSIFKDKADIEKLQRCNKGESCQCRTLSSLEAFPWSNRFSRTLKQLSIAQSPKGHVSFPSILDLSLFTNTGIGIKTPVRPSSQQLTAFPRFMYQTTPLDPGTGIAIENGPRLEALDASLPGSSNEDATIRPLRPPMYRLVSVVEHFGGSGGGHYTVYRNVRGKIGDGDDVGLLESATHQWFCISDSQVDSVLEREVLDANASMLFYEKLEKS